MPLYRRDFIKLAGLASFGGSISATGIAAADDLKPLRVYRCKFCGAWIPTRANVTQVVRKAA